MTNKILTRLAIIGLIGIGIMPLGMASDGSGCESAGWTSSPADEIPTIGCYSGKIFEQNEKIISNQEVIKMQNSVLILEQAQANKLSAFNICYKGYENFDDCVKRVLELSK